MSKKDIVTDYKSNYFIYNTISSKKLKLEREKVVYTRTRSDNMSNSLSLCIHDPLWMLSRQWQLGEFRGNDAGTALAVSCKIRSSAIAQEQADPFEYGVERTDVEITPKVRVESALYYIKLLRNSGITLTETLITTLKAKYPLDNDYCKCGIDDKATQEYAKQQNSKLIKFLNTYRDRAFDGYKLYQEIVSSSSASEYNKNFCKWFEEKYFPCKQTPSAWDIKHLGYDAKLNMQQGELNAKKYSGGRMSWYSFDSTKVLDKANGVVEDIPSLPTLATYAGAPAKRLWQFEDHRVYLGNSTDTEQSQANVLMMQYGTMYGNDWMLIPLQIQFGNYVQVEELKVWDTFGQTFTANSMTNFDNSSATTYDQQWRMFSIAPENSDSKNSGNKKEMNGMLLPPCFIDTLEGTPIEEVVFLRDEMSNMIWAVETLLPDGTGTTLDGKEYAAKIAEYIEELMPPKTALSDNRNYDFSYHIQNRVPLNWIPFVPQRYKKDNENRETILRRGKMPCFVYSDNNKKNGEYYLPIRPVSSLIRCEIVADKNGKITEKPLYINEEEILQTGIKVIKNYQHGRWFNGKIYHWVGRSKQLSKTETESGLTFDKLIQKNSDK